MKDMKMEEPRIFNETLPNGFERYKMFSMSRKFTRILNGTNKYKTSPKYYRIKLPSDGFWEIRKAFFLERKRRRAGIPFID